MFSVGCFHTPDVSKIKCADNASCPSGYVCAIPGQPGGCKKQTNAVHGGGIEEPSNYDATPSAEVATGIDGSRTTEAGIAMDGASGRLDSAVDQGTTVGVDASDSKLGADLAPDVSLSGPPLDSGTGGTGGQMDGAAGGAGGGSGGTGGGGPEVGSSDGGPPGLDVALDGNSEGAGGSGGSTGTGGSAGGNTGTGGDTTGAGGGSGGITSTGGTAVGTGGTGTGGTGTGGAGTGGAPARPPGYWMASDWNLTGVPWAGCAWTQIDTVTATTTTITPPDFTARPAVTDPYHVSGSVFTDYNSVAVLGFNLNEAITGASNQCAHRIFDATTVLPPGVTFLSAATGISIDWNKAAASTLRIELRGPNGTGDATDRWCANITDVGGPSFVPFTRFNTRCWDNSGSYYDGTSPVSAMVFYVPGSTQATPFDFTINSFNISTAAATGTIGGTTANAYQRVKVKGSDTKQYIIQNNNFGNATGSTQTISYVGNSFKVVSSTASGTSTPASFPSIYIGQNGTISGGAYQTTDSSLPRQISALQNAQSSFAWSGGTSGGDFNAAFDLWFAKAAPAAGSYTDAISGEIMIWLYKPAGHQPTGVSGNTRVVTIGRQTYDVWRGPRGLATTGTDGVGRPVISYVARTTNANFTGNLKNFIDDAVTNGNADMNAVSGITQAIAGTWYLTNVFAGFQIWTGTDATNLQCTSFTCAVE